MRHCNLYEGKKKAIFEQRMSFHFFSSIAAWPSAPLNCVMCDIWGRNEESRRQFSVVCYNYGQLSFYCKKKKKSTFDSGVYCIFVFQWRLLHSSPHPPPSRLGTFEGPDCPFYPLPEDSTTSGKPPRARGGRSHLPQPLLCLPHLATRTQVGTHHILVHTQFDIQESTLTFLFFSLSIQREKFVLALSPKLRRLCDDDKSM